MLVLTSTIFSTNAVHALCKGCWAYAAAFAALTATSIWYHSSGMYDDETAFLCDQLAIIMVVLIGVYYVSKQSYIQIFLPFIFFVGVCVAYFTGVRHELVQMCCSASHHFIMAGIA